jgi:hypothetical protein
MTNLTHQTTSCYNCWGPTAQPANPSTVAICVKCSRQVDEARAINDGVPA